MLSRQVTLLLYGPPCVREMNRRPENGTPVRSSELLSAGCLGITHIGDTSTGQVPELHEE